jgi:hypothetical protein
MKVPERTGERQRAVNDRHGDASARSYRVTSQSMIVLHVASLSALSCPAPGTITNCFGPPRAS